MKDVTVSPAAQAEVNKKIPDTNARGQNNLPEAVYPPSFAGQLGYPTVFFANE